MRTIRLYTSLILSLLAVGSFAAPRLTVVAVVDGLTTENLALLRPYWQQGGLRTLSEEAFQTSIAFPQLVFGGNETTATLVTGCTPDRHGYTMDTYFSRRDRRTHAMLTDEQVHGIGTNLHLSPRALLARTVTDRMRILYPAAKIYAVGIQPETTVLLAGHAANACCWIDPASRQWVATAAYTEGLPTAAYDYNNGGRFEILAAHQWTPRMDIPMYNKPTEQERKKAFSYTVANVLTKSPEANTLVMELALALHRIDFYLEKKSERTLMEVKGCTLEIDGIGYFPDAPTERGVKHLHELAGAVKDGYRAVLAFAIQMNGITEVRPNIRTHPEFGTALEQAREAGVSVLFLPCHVEPDGLWVNRTEWICSSD